MSVKDEVIKLIQDLPDNVTVEDILYKLYVRARIDEGISELDAGKGINHSEAMERINKWLN
jgi:predicted transcriptional regulator